MNGNTGARSARAATLYFYGETVGRTSLLLNSWYRFSRKRGAPRWPRSELKRENRISVTRNVWTATVCPWPPAVRPSTPELLVPFFRVNGVRRDGRDLSEIQTASARERGHWRGTPIPLGQVGNSIRAARGSVSDACPFSGPEGFPGRSPLTVHLVLTLGAS